MMGHTTQVIRTHFCPCLALSTICAIVKEYVLHWERIGLNLSTLLVDEEYLRFERPEAYKEHEKSVGEVAGLVDGKDIVTDTFRMHSGFKRQLWSAIMKMSALRVLTISTPTGLVYCYSDPFLARIGESRVIELMGSVG